MVALLRGVNVGGKAKIRMEELRRVCEGMGLEGVRTYIQSGNIVFRTKKRLTAKQLEDGLEKAFGFRPLVMLRTVDELRSVIERNPIAGVEPHKLLVFFLAAQAKPESAEAVRKMEISPERIEIDGMEMYIHFPNGQGVSKLPMARVERALGTTGTGRNWNTVQALLAMAEEAG